MCTAAAVSSWFAFPALVVLAQTLHQGAQKSSWLYCCCCGPKILSTVPVPHLVLLDAFHTPLTHLVDAKGKVVA